MSSPDGNDRPKKRGRYLAWGDPDVDDDNVPRTTLYRRGLQVQNDQATSHNQREYEPCEVPVASVQASTQLTLSASSSAEESSQDDSEISDDNCRLLNEALHAPPLRHMNDVDMDFNHQDPAHSDNDSNCEGSEATTEPEDIYCLVDSCSEAETVSDEEIHDNFFIPTDYSILDNQNEGEQQPQPEEVAEAASQDDLNETAESLQDTEGAASRAAAVVATSNQPAYESTLKELLSEKYSACISSNICVSRREVIYNILNMCEAHKVNNTVFIGMFKIVNSMFGEPILPDTHYKLDQLLFSVCGLKYHFYCSKLSCKKLLKVKDVTLPIVCKCGQVTFISDLTQASYFVTFDICTQLEMLLRDPDIACLLLDMKSYRRATASVRDLYDGEVYQKLISSIDFNDGAKHLSTVFCVDATPMYKSSSCEIVPMQATINEFPPLLRMKRPILLGLWFGSEKPNYKSFFKPVIKSLNKLSEVGATIDCGGVRTFVKVHGIGCCVDSGVRGAIQGVHQHNGIYGCNWCLHPGVLEGGGSTARKYPYLEIHPGLRTHLQVQHDADVVKTLPRSTAPSAPKPHINGVIESSPLLNLHSLDIVDGLVVDTMHNVFLGVMRQFLRLWTGSEGNIKLPDNSLPSYYIGSPSVLAKINRRIALFVPPLEVRRLPRPLTDIVHMKARELENYLLYFLVPSLRGILPDKYLKHFVLYVQGMYLVMKDEILPEDFPASSFLLEKFVKEIHDLYLNPNFSEDKQNTFNVHLTLHAVENARRWGPGWSVSAFPYENGNGDLADTIEANRGIPDQVARALCKRNLQNLLSQEIDSANCASFLNEISSRKPTSITFIGNVKVFGLTPQEFQPNAEELFLLHQSSLNANDFCVAKKFIFNNCVFAPRQRTIKHRNDFVKLTTGEIVQVKKVIASETLETILIFYSKVHVRAYSVQVDAHLTISTPFMYDVLIIEQEQHLGNHLTFSKPCVYSDLRSEGGKETVSVMAHVVNVT